MNWRRGLLGVWIVLSVLWVGGLLWLCWPVEWEYLIGHGYSEAYVMGEAISAEIFAKYAFIPPAALFVFGLMLIWAARGFHSQILSALLPPI